jgi:CO/xanthine dehydrogenase Mo-binding subunit
VGDAVAILAGETEKAVDRAMKLIKVTYEVLEPILDMHDSLDNPILIHPEDNWHTLNQVGADNKRNIRNHMGGRQAADQRKVQKQHRPEYCPKMHR